MNRTIILADDLTGANDTAIQFVKHGLKALVITQTEFPESAVDPSYEVLSPSTKLEIFDYLET